MRINNILIRGKTINTFLELTGDKNKAHYEDKYAQDLGRQYGTKFERRLAPGMFTGPLVLYKALSRPNMPDVNTFRHFKFLWANPVYPDDKLYAQVFGNEDELELKVFNQSNTAVMKVQCRRNADKIEIPRGEGREFSKTITKKDTGEFADIVRSNASGLKIPALYVGSFVPPSLLLWSGGKGLHIMQECNIHSMPELIRDMDISATTYFKKKNGNKYTGRHVCRAQNGKILQTGKIVAYTKDGIADL